MRSISASYFDDMVCRPSQSALQHVAHQVGDRAMPWECCACCALMSNVRMIPGQTTYRNASYVAFQQTLTTRGEAGPKRGIALGGGEHRHPPGPLPQPCKLWLTYASSQAAAMPLPRFVVNERDAMGGDQEEAEEASSSESEQDEEADMTDAEEDGSDAEEPQQEAGPSDGRQTALPRSVPAEETPRAKLTFKLKKQRASDEVCHVCLLGMQPAYHNACLCLTLSAATRSACDRHKMRCCPCLSHCW